MPLDEDLPLEEAYFLWLCSQVGQSEKLRNKNKTYWTLLKLLHHKEFTWEEIERDANRASDGRNLRWRFLQETGYHNEGDFREFGCDMLELLIALSWDLAWDGGGEQADWFWVLIENLGLAQCTDAHPPDELMVSNILDRVINRDYASNGHGGLFPLKHAADDQRHVELHYQAQAYLLENVPI